MRRKLDLIRDLFFMITIISSPLASAEPYDSWSDVDMMATARALVKNSEAMNELDAASQKIDHKLRDYCEKVNLSKAQCLDASQLNVYQAYGLLIGFSLAFPTENISNSRLARRYAQDAEKSNFFKVTTPNFSDNDKIKVRTCNSKYPANGDDWLFCMEVIKKPYYIYIGIKRFKLAREMGHFSDFDDRTP